jgi:RNA polymerase sigma factor (sigma-70 family)
LKTYAAIEEDELYKLLNSCRKGDAMSQERLYAQFYAYSMSICLRYSKTREEAIEILNDGFYKIFTKIGKHDKAFSFKGWLRQVMINSAIDYFRRNEKHYHGLDISYLKYSPTTASVIDDLSEQEIVEAIRQLPPSYRIVFNLYVIEGFNHEEIARQLSIGVGTSKSNLAMARNKLKKILIADNAERLTEKQNG